MNDEQQLWAYIAQLERAIRQSMEQSEEIAEIIGRLLDSGVHVTINCIAQIVTPEGTVLQPPQEADENEQELAPSDHLELPSGPQHAVHPFESTLADDDDGDDDEASRREQPPLRFGFDDDDLRFLDGLGIRLD